jgi:signal peptidase I
MTVRRIASVARMACIALFAAFAVAVAGVGLAARLAPMAGAEVYTIRSGSMEPAIAIGSLVVVTKGAEPAQGDVIAYRLPNGAVVTHRIARVVAGDAGRFLETRGDANPDPDPSLVREDAVVGQVTVVVPILGFVLALLGMPIGIVTLLSVAGTLLTAIWLLEELEDAESADALRTDPPRAARPSLPRPMR